MSATTQRILFFIFALLSVAATSVHATALQDLRRLQHAYSDHIIDVTEKKLLWRDGSIMLIQDGHPNKTMQEKLDHPALFDQLVDVHYTQGLPKNIASFAPQDDPGRIRFEPFFRKMYGNSKAQVMSHLVTIYWMPAVFGTRYPLNVTTVNGIDKKLAKISKELESLVALHPEYRKFLDQPGGTFCWRVIANTDRLSPHSFGMTIDINTEFSDYWQWDLKKAGLPISEDAPLTYHNRIPWEIVLIFEKYGFIWGGKWHHYDTMHFEYRPEIL